MKHYMLTEPAFVAGALLVPGSVINDADLGETDAPERDKDGKVVPGGKTKRVQVKPPSTAVEVDPQGRPKSDEDAVRLAQVIGNVSGVPIAPVQPHAPNPTHPQGAPAQGAGGVQFAERQLPTEPAEGVESNAAAEARTEQREEAQATATAISEAAESPRRRGK